MRTDSMSEDPATEVEIPPSEPHEGSHGIYEPLKQWETRLIELLPGKFEEDVACNLHVAVVTAAEGFGLAGEDRQQIYEAISYTWGRPELTAPVICNGMRTFVPPPLLTALRYLRYEQIPRFLWCDALYVDQTNLIEKAAQVQAMWMVFDKAHRVVAWLGEFDEQTAAEMSLNEHLVFNLPYFTRVWTRSEISRIGKVVFQFNYTTVNPFINIQDRSSGPLEPGGLQLAVEDSAWERVSIIKADHVRNSNPLRMLRENSALPYNEMENKFVVRSLFAKRFVELMLSNQRFMCTDQRDIVYSFSARLQDRWSDVLDFERPGFLTLEADYGITFEQLQEVVIKFIINVHGDYHLLEWHRPTEMGSAISWLPTWNAYPIVDSRGRPSKRTFQINERPGAHANFFHYQSLESDGCLQLSAFPIGFCDAPQDMKPVPMRSEWYSEHDEYMEAQGLAKVCWTIWREFRGKPAVLRHAGIADYRRAEAGDAIVVPAGRSLPCIIRPLGDGRYRFVGYCRWAIYKEEWSMALLVTRFHEWIEHIMFGAFLPGEKAEPTDEHSRSEPASWNDFITILGREWPVDRTGSQQTGTHVADAFRRYTLV